MTELSNKDQWKANWKAEWLADWCGDSKLSKHRLKEIELGAERAYERHLLSEKEHEQENTKSILFSDVVILKATLPSVIAEVNTWNNAEELGMTCYRGSFCAAWKGDGFILTVRERSKNLDASGIGIEWVGKYKQETRKIWDELLVRLLAVFEKFTPEEIEHLFPREYDRRAKKTLSHFPWPYDLMTKAEESEWNAKKKVKEERRAGMTADEIVAEFLGGSGAQPSVEQAADEFLGANQQVSKTDAALASPEKASDVQNHVRGGRPSFSDDLWAWNQVIKCNRPKNEVYPEWLEKIQNNPKRANLVDPERQFKRIVKAEWGNKS